MFIPYYQICYFRILWPNHPRPNLLLLYVMFKTWYNWINFSKVLWDYEKTYLPHMNDLIRGMRQIMWASHSGGQWIFYLLCRSYESDEFMYISYIRYDADLILLLQLQLISIAQCYALHLWVVQLHYSQLVNQYLRLGFA